MSYDIYTESKSAHDSLIAAFASKVTCGENCSAAFSADFRTNMQRNNVDSDLIDSIQADSSASVQESAKDQPTENQPDGSQQSSTPSSQADDEVQADNASEGTTPSGQLVPGVDNWILYSVGGLVAIMVLIAVVPVIRSRCPRKGEKPRLADETDQTFSKRSVVEMQHTNPMKKHQVVGAAIGIVNDETSSGSEESGGESEHY